MEDKDKGTIHHMQILPTRKGLTPKVLNVSIQILPFSYRLISSSYHLASLCDFVPSCTLATILRSTSKTKATRREAKGDFFPLALNLSLPVRRSTQWSESRN